MNRSLGLEWLELARWESGSLHAQNKLLVFDPVNFANEFQTQWQAAKARVSRTAQSALRSWALAGFAVARPSQPPGLDGP